MGGVSFLKLNEKRKIWANHVGEFKSSSLSQKSWCEKKGINVNAFRYWLKKLEGETITHSNSSSDGFELASVSIMKNHCCPEVTLEIKDVKVSIMDDYDEKLLLKLIKTLKKL